MFERALVIKYLSQSRNKTISGIRLKNSIFESHFGENVVNLGHSIAQGNILVGLLAFGIALALLLWGMGL